MHWLILDGNNLIHRDPTLAAAARRDFDVARRRLIRLLDEQAGELADRITVVFDSRMGPADTAAYRTPGVEVVFSTADRSADAVIERLACQGGADRRITVVSSDRAERESVEAAGVHTISCLTFLERLEAARHSQGRKLRSGNRAGPKGQLGDFFPTERT